MPGGFDTADEAAKAALREAVELSGKVEHAGAIYEQNGAYHFTPPKSSGETHSVTVTVGYPKGANLVGLYHTHTEGEESALFSSGDIEIAEKLELPYYMGHYADGAMRVFRPGESRTYRGSGGKNTVSRGLRSEGELLGNAFETPENPVAMAGPPL